MGTEGNGPTLGDRPLVHASKPRFRGRFHQGAFIASIPLGLALVAVSSDLTARVATAIYALSVIGMYGTSAAYHRLPWSADGQRWMRRFDHSMIFVLIAGTYTPIVVLVTDPPWTAVMLGLVWVGAGVGVSLKMAVPERPDGRVSPGMNIAANTLYIVVGWLALIILPELIRTLPWPALVLLVLGGLLYTAGAIVLNRRAPDPSPEVFGYHEVWHTMVVGGSLCHYLMILIALLALT